MSNEQLTRYAPSVFAAAPSHRMSERYTFIPTIAVVEGLRSAGWAVVAAAEQRVRLDDRKGVQKHMLRLRRADGMQALNVGDSITELVLSNSHDGSSAYEAVLGLFRKVCSNGLHVAAGTLSTVKVRHSGRAADEVVEGSFRLMDETPRLVEAVDGMRAVQLTAGEQTAFASAALAARYEVDAAPVAPTALLTPRRWDDRGADLWSTFNRVQEHMIRGGLRGRNTAGKRTTTRAVTGLDADTKLNRALWTLAEEMRKLKTA
jgi:hypothetical protein